MACARQPEAQRGGGQHDDDRHEDGTDPVGKALNGRLSRLCCLDESGHLGQRGLGPDAGGPHDQPARHVDRRPGHGVARFDIDGHTFAGQQRCIDSGGSLLDDAVGGDSLAGQDDESIPDLQFVDRPFDLFAGR